MVAQSTLLVSCFISLAPTVAGGELRGSQTQSTSEIPSPDFANESLPDLSDLQLEFASASSRFCWNSRPNPVDVNLKSVCSRFLDTCEWNYEYPACWKLNAKPCAWACDGKRQSPVYFEVFAAPTGESANLVQRMWYPLSWYLHVKNTGHNLQVDAVDRGHIIGPDSAEYQLLGFHVHTPSEHLVRYKPAGGYVAQAEMHFLHQNRFTSEKLVLALRFVTDNSAPAHKLLEKMGKPKKDEVLPIYGEVDIMSALKIFEKGYLYYEGSLTTPPCTENVHWYIAYEEVKVPSYQLDDISCLITSTFRDAEPLHARAWSKHLP